MPIYTFTYYEPGLTLISLSHQHAKTVRFRTTVDTNNTPTSFQKRRYLARMITYASLNHHRLRHLLSVRRHFFTSSRISFGPMPVPSPVPINPSAYSAFILLTVPSVILLLLCWTPVFPPDFSWSICKSHNASTSISATSILYYISYFYIQRLRRPSTTVLHSFPFHRCIIYATVKTRNLLWPVSTG